MTAFFHTCTGFGKGLWAKDTRYFCTKLFASYGISTGVLALYGERSNGFTLTARTRVIYDPKVRRTYGIYRTTFGTDRISQKRVTGPSSEQWQTVARETPLAVYRWCYEDCTNRRRKNGNAEEWTNEEGCARWMVRVKIKTQTSKQRSDDFRGTSLTAGAARLVELTCCDFVFGRGLYQLGFRQLLIERVVKNVRLVTTVFWARYFTIF